MARYMMLLFVPQGRTQEEAAAESPQWMSYTQDLLDSGAFVADDGVNAVERAFREEGPAVLATLIRQVGDIGLAEDALQDAFAAAVATWPRDGVPASPGAWITTTARRRAIDRLRRERGIADRVERLRVLAERDAAAAPEDPVESAVGDDRLRLMFTCCHPALSRDAQAALTLRLLGGLTTAEVARAFH